MKEKKHAFLEMDREKYLIGGIERFLCVVSYEYTIYHSHSRAKRRRYFCMHIYRKETLGESRRHCKRRIYILNKLIIWSMKGDGGWRCVHEIQNKYRLTPTTAPFLETNSQHPKRNLIGNSDHFYVDSMRPLAMCND